jgi:hypothetical protein
MADVNDPLVSAGQSGRRRDKEVANRAPRSE